ncbi:MAG TPA: GNAT family N-acetyltransferase [Dongiaceae bacterium]|nr:GNAT family N-acetyltransferase [Dongiaceae bacterium]
MSGGGIAIRDAVPGDADALAAMAQEFADELAALPVSANAPEVPEPDIALTSDILMRDLFGAEPHAHVLLAEIGGRPAGYLMYHFGYWPADAAAALHMVDLFVRLPARRHGVARALIREAGALLQQKGGRRLIWTVWDQNHAAIAFYRRLGARFFAEERLMTLRL